MTIASRTTPITTPSRRPNITAMSTPAKGKLLHQSVILLRHELLTDNDNEFPTEQRLLLLLVSDVREDLNVILKISQDVDV